MHKKVEQLLHMLVQKVWKERSMMMRGAGDVAIDDENDVELA